MKIILVTPFKVGSTFLSFILRNSYYYIESWEQHEECDESYNKNNNFLLRGHTALNYNLINNNKFDIWFTLIRKPTNIYSSGFFQDITDENGSKYPYYYGSKETVLNKTHENLITHFLNFEWNKYEQFSFDFNFHEIFKYTNINIWEQEFDKKKGYSIYNNLEKNIKVCVLTIETLPKIHDILNELNIFTNNENVFNQYSMVNCSEDKWYNKKYIEFKNNLPNGYYEKYKLDDEKIVKKFYK